MSFHFYADDTQLYIPFNCNDDEDMNRDDKENDNEDIEIEFTCPIFSNEDEDVYEYLEEKLLSQNMETIEPELI